MIKLDRQIDAQTFVEEAIADYISKTGSDAKWMNVFFVVENGKVICKNRTTWNFPAGDFPGVVAELLKNLFEEIERIITEKNYRPTVPLPKAVLPEINKTEPNKEPLSILDDAISDACNMSNDLQEDDDEENQDYDYPTKMDEDALHKDTAFGNERDN